MSDERRDFVSLALAGEAMADEIDDFIDRWHARPADPPLHDFLGMNRDEYELWLTAPDPLPLILSARIRRRPLEAVARDGIAAVRSDARTDCASKIGQLEAWLQRRERHGDAVG